MQLPHLTALVLPLLVRAAPLETRQDDCAPFAYTLDDFTYTSSPSGASITFDIKSEGYLNITIIDDPLTKGANCDVKAADGNIPFENVCSTGQSSFFYDLRAEAKNADFQLIHTWRCNGHEWMSSTHHKIDPLYCDTDATTSTTTCQSSTNYFPPENVRQICGAPTCS